MSTPYRQGEDAGETHGLGAKDKLKPANPYPKTRKRMTNGSMDMRTAITTGAWRKTMMSFNLEFKTMKTLLLTTALLATATLTACDDASVASRNLSKAADNFEIPRRVVFYNGITGDYILSVQGLCSVQNSGSSVSFTCKTDEGKYVKHMLGLSDNVTYFSEQLSALDVSVYNYRVTFKPDTIVPDFNLRSKMVDDDSNH